MEHHASGPDYLARAGKFTVEDMLRIQEDAARLQAEVNAQVMTALVNGLGRATRRVGLAIGRFLREQWVGVAAYRVHGELSRLSDHQLARLGIRRDEIASYVASVVAAGPAEQPVALKAIAGGRIAGDTAAEEQPVRRRAA